jgi:hypothetical protein
MQSSPKRLESSVQQSSAPNRHLRLTLVVQYVVAAILALTLFAYMLIGNFTRYVADDYGTVLAVRLRGYWAQQIADYRLSDGHFVATALQSGAVLLHPVFARILPGALIATWVALLTLGLRHVVPAARRLGRFLIAAGIVYTTLRLAPSPFLTFYWMTASLAFVVPLIIAAVLVWLVSRPSYGGRRGTAVIAVTGFLAFVAAGEAETYTVAQAVALTLAIGVALSGLSAIWRRKLAVLTAAWAGSVTGLAVELASPGNVIRARVISRLIVVPRPSLLGLPFFTFAKMLHFAQELVGEHWRGMLALLLLASWLGARSGGVTKSATRSAMIALVLTILGSMAVVLSALAPAALEYGALPPLYDQIVPVYVCVCSVATLGWIGGRFCQHLLELKWARARQFDRGRGAFAAATSLFVGAALVIGPITTIASIHQDLPAIQAYANVKDAQAAAAMAAHAAGRSSALVPTLANYKDLGIFSHTGLEELYDDPRYFVNRDEAGYYGIVSMATAPGPIPPP